MCMKCNAASKYECFFVFIFHNFFRYCFIRLFFDSGFSGALLLLSLSWNYHVSERERREQFYSSTVFKQNWNCFVYWRHSEAHSLVLFLCVFSAMNMCTVAELLSQCVCVYVSVSSSHTHLFVLWSCGCIKIFVRIGIKTNTEHDCIEHALSENRMENERHRFR